MRISLYSWLPWCLHIIVLRGWPRVTAQSTPTVCDPFQYFTGDPTDVKQSKTLQAAFRDIDQWIEEWSINTDVPSISFGVVYDQELVHYSSWGRTHLQDKSANKPTPDSIYRIGSISKVFTVLMIMKLRDERMLSLDDPIAFFEPEFEISNPWGITEDEQRGKTLTIRQLASQVSGLPRAVPCQGEEECVNITTHEVLNLLKNASLLHATDTEPSYSNLAFAILGNILAKYGGANSFEQMLLNKIIEPMGLDHTGLHPSPEQSHYFVTGYDRARHPVRFLERGWRGPSGQVFSSVRDMSTLLAQFFAAHPGSTERHLSSASNFTVAPQSLREMLRPVFWHPDQKTGYGMPWELLFSSHPGHILRTKGGNVEGFSSEIALVPELKLGVIVLVNLDFASKFQVAQAAMDILIPAFEQWSKEQKLEHEADTPKPTGDESAMYQAMQGSYLADDGKTLLIVHLDEASGRPLLSAPIVLGHGSLELSREVNHFCRDAPYTTFVYHEVFPSANPCFSATILDGNEVTFVRYSSENNRQKNDVTAFDEVRIDHLFFGLKFRRVDSDHKPTLEKREDEILSSSCFLEALTYPKSY